MSIPVRRISKEKRARIRKIAQENPDVSIALLAERFGTTEHVITGALLGLPPRERDGLTPSYRSNKNQLTARRKRMTQSAKVGGA